MKKKVALLLVGAMAFSAAMPMSVFAGSTNKLQTVTIAKPGAYLSHDNFNLTYGEQDYAGREDVIVGRGETLDITFSTLPKNGDTFALELENAIWDFRSTYHKNTSIVTEPIEWDANDVLAALGGTFVTDGQTVQDIGLTYEINATSTLLSSDNTSVDVYVQAIPGAVAPIIYLRDTVASKERFEQFLLLYDLEGKDKVPNASAFTSAVTAATLDNWFKTNMYDETLMDSSFDRGLSLVDNVTASINNMNYKAVNFETVGTVNHAPLVSAEITKPAGWSQGTFEGPHSTIAGQGANPNGLGYFEPLVVRDYDIIDDDEDVEYVKLKYHAEGEQPPASGSDYLDYTIEISRDRTEAWITIDNPGTLEPGDALHIPMILKLGDKEETSYVNITETNQSEVSAQKLAITYNLAGRTESDVVPVTARNLMEINEISIKELTLSTIQSSGWFKLTLEEDYAFANDLEGRDDWEYVVGDEDDELKIDSAFVSNNPKIRAYRPMEVRPDDDMYGSEMYIYLWDHEVSTSLLDTLYLDGLMVRAKDPESEEDDEVMLKIEGMDGEEVYEGWDSYDDYDRDEWDNLWDGDVPIEIADGTEEEDDEDDRHWRGDSGITVDDIVIANRVNYGVKLEVEDAVEMYSGFEDQKAAQITLSEKLANSWTSRGTSTFTLVDEDGEQLQDVKFSGIYFDDLNGFVDHPIGFEEDAEIATLKPDGKHYLAENSKTGAQLYVDESEVEFRYLVADEDEDTEIVKPAFIEMIFLISAEAGWSGDVYLLADLPTAGDQEFDPLHIATVKEIVEIETEMTETEIGVQQLDIADITLTEEKPGVWKKNETIEVGIYNGFNKMTTIDGIEFGRITSKNMVINEKESGFEAKVAESEEGISITVNSQSDDEPAQIVLKDLTLYVSRTVSEGPYDLLVGGSAITTNYVQGNTTASSNDGDFSLDFFGVEGYLYPDYLNILTPEAGGGLNNNIVVVQDQNTYMLDGQPQDLGSPVRNIDSSIYVPVRFMVQALGIDDQTNANWNATERSFLVEAPNGRTIKFTDGSAIMIVDGNDWPMYVTGPDGNPTLPYVELPAFIETDPAAPGYETMYVPLRQFANAFKVEVVWDDANKTVYINPTESDLESIAAANE